MSGRASVCLCAVVRDVEKRENTHLPSEGMEESEQHRKC